MSKTSYELEEPSPDAAESDEFTAPTDPVVHRLTTAKRRLRFSRRRVRTAPDGRLIIRL